MTRLDLIHGCGKLVWVAAAACAMLFPSSARAQGGETPGVKLAPRSSFYVELMGSAIGYSLNYDYRVTPHLALRAGLEAWGGTGSFVGIFPITASGLIGKNQNNFEIGGGPVILTGGGDLHNFNTTVIGSAFVAYRLQPPGGGFFFRAGIGPLFNSKTFIIWPLFAFGASF